MELKKLARELQYELDNKIVVQANILDQCSNAIILCRNLLMKFKEEIVTTKFKDGEVEIEFFKEIKQVPLSNLVYYFELKAIEILFPKGSEEVQKNYIQQKLSNINSFFTINVDFVQYIEQGKTFLDDRYFSRKYFDEFNITHSKYYFRDPNFSSSHDLLLAKLLANTRLISYLEKRLKSIGNHHHEITVLENLVWTASRTDMTELGYSLKRSGAVNQGNVSIKEIIHGLERLFNFDSGDPYKNFSEIRLRKKSRTKFLDELSIGLLSKMDTQDL